MPSRHVGPLTLLALGGLALGGASALAGCGGATQSSSTQGTVARASSYVPCERPSEVRFAPGLCFDPVGTRWHVVANAPGGRYEFDVELMASGRLRANDHPAAGPGTDEWIIEDDQLRLFLANRYVEYRGRFTNGSVIVGSASNVRGDAWEFRADRMRVPHACQGNELVVRGGDEPVCYSAAGSRWQMHLGGRSFVVELASNGALTSDDPNDTTAGDDTWEQVGGTLRMYLNGRTTTLEATLRPDALDRLEGTASVGGSFTAEALPSYAGAPY